MKELVYLCAILVMESCYYCLAQSWKSNGRLEYYTDSQDLVFTFNEAQNECAKLNATLIMVKTKEVEKFIVAQNWQSKY